MPKLPQSPGHPQGSPQRVWYGLLALILLLRLLTLASLPLTDHTEARYAEIARLMLQLQDWISPHITPTEVFWAKPPLSTWSQALSMTVFGVSPWAARLPAVLWSCAALGAAGWMLKGSLSRLQTLVVLVALALSPLFFIAAGAVMTDATLAATTLFVQAAWWRVLRSHSAPERLRLARWLGFGAGLALLTKGPAAVVLTLLPIFMHAAWRRHWPAIRAVASDVWVWLICLGVALPWYVAAELKTPGFMEYFVLGEHVMRFMQPGWSGDRYGFAHAQPLGIIWPYTFVAALPAALILLLRLPYLRIRQGAGALRAQFHQTDGGVDLACYALCIALAPLLLFSAASNLIWTYAMTALPGLAILAVMACPQAWFERTISWGLGLALLLLYAWAFVFKLPQEAAKHSDQSLIAAYEQACGSQSCRLSYMSKPDYSAYFYTAGRLYAGMPGQASAPAFKVIHLAKDDPLRSDALACNRDQCLLRDLDADAALVNSIR
ncbi:phospholipid carrier-dependent glycosyltransferase [Paucibacter sp. TC2R-5]|uniref:ArnT family glycosyltransferase n=1 Tax=Paucibacter sp. TC2R-5 TaxID=2893555 RepID=UPI0021E477F0|nr:phospholipid carrier-dependent glycosyltransferase [Paucibacter sp. TC2R-5]MCV2358111.1 phospholipid carrier-dependent glycosyltransferase [Paucibacter sp. TC2R-5]